ncbi:MAG: tripartite tricarboxylate transporter substrate binding protein [Deltaproteobacteria bacterium]|nr:tripartite tricarboxylate transporter substrate binding protein [Deltaproteobacteria bacterium]
MRRENSRTFIIFFALAIVNGSLTSGALAAEKQFPSRFIEAVVPFSPGGAVDNSIRIIGAEAEKTLGQKITVLNKPAGGSVEGQRYVANAKPDGYTLLAMTSSVVSNILTKNVDFTLGSFDPLIMYCFDPFVFVVNADLPYKTLAEVIAASKTKPMAASTPGKANSKHIAGMIIEEKTGAKFNYVHTKGASEGVPMIAGGHVQVGCWAWAEVRPLVEQNKLRPIAVMAEQRDPDFPNVPTFKEAGFAIYYGAWRGIAAPKGLSPDVKDFLIKAFTKAVTSAEVKERFDKAGFPVVYKGADDFRKYIEEDYISLKKTLEELK